MSESDRKMHASEVVIDTSLVGRLIAAQFPEWAGLPLEPVRSAGTDNAIYRLGVDLAVRLPRIPAAAGQVDKEHRWLPQLAPLLPLNIPVPLGTGTPGEGYPWPWSVHRWLEGEDLLAEPAVDLHRMAIELGNFVAALQQVDPTGGPPPGTHNFFRGAPLARRDAATRAAIHTPCGPPSTPQRRPRRGTRPCTRPAGRERRYGSTATFSPGICSPGAAGCMPSSTSAAWAWEIRPAT